MENVQGDSWLQVGIHRNSRGIEIFVRADGAVEEFIKSLSEPKLDPITEYGTTWQAVPTDTPIMVYRPIRDLSTASYVFGNVGGHLILTKTRQVNLSFLQFQGVGGEGVKFALYGPFGRDYVTSLSETFLKAAHEFIRNYIVPVNVQLRISSKEF